MYPINSFPSAFMKPIIASDCMSPKAVVWRLPSMELRKTVPSTHAGYACNLKTATEADYDTGKYSNYSAIHLNSIINLSVARNGKSCL